ncbi:LapA family protein [Pseudomonas sp. CAU 1711]|uniref:LapA family protein n=1 Tax=Pseudomonas sp. CAU 1711 TaxID=3140356 RepID=UPI0032611B3D
MLDSVKRLIGLLVLLLIGAAILLLILQNPQRTQFHFLHWATPELPFSIFLILAFVLGILSVAILRVLRLGRFKGSRSD